MTIASQLEALTTNLAAAKGAVTTKGGTVGDTGLAGLASEIGTIPTGQSGPLDPVVVYANNRPSNWLQMPSDANVADNEIYYLLEVDANRIDDLKLGVHHSTNSAKYDVDFGTVVNGAFVPDSSYYVHDVVSTTKTTLSVPMSVFQTIGSEKQVIMRTKVQPGGYLFTMNTLYSGDRFVLEIKGKATQCVNLNVSASGTLAAAYKLRYFTLLGTNAITNYYRVFTGCINLEAVVSLDTSNATSFSEIFSGCSGLVALPSISAPNATTCASMFYGCKSIKYIPSINVPNCTSFNSTFKDCLSLEENPQVTTSSCTSFAGMFYNCLSLERVNLFDTSHGTTFNQMFGSCYKLKSVPLFDLSSATDLASMFIDCSKLQDVPTFNTSNATKFDTMFQSCASLHKAPALNTSSGTSFNSMFFNCASLEEIPQYDISNATVITKMFNTCTSLEYVDFSNYDFSSVTTPANAANFISASTIVGGGNVYFPGIDKFPAAGIQSTGSQNHTMFAFTAGTGDYTSFNGVNIIITEDSGMIPLQGTAYTVFGKNAYNPTVYVPDSLYATYAADTNWSELGDRLKKMSDLPA